MRTYIRLSVNDSIALASKITYAAQQVSKAQAAEGYAPFTKYFHTYVHFMDADGNEYSIRVSDDNE